MDKKFIEFYKKYKDFMYYVANSILKDSRAAEHAVQKAFIKIHRNFQKVEDIESAEAKHLALTVTKRTAINIYYQQQRQKARELPSGKSARNQQATAATNDDVVLGCIQRLPKKYTDVLILKHTQGYRPKEIADMLGTSPRAVRAYLSRGKKLLRGEFKKSGIRVRI